MSIYLQSLLVYCHTHLSVFVPLVIYLSFVITLCIVVIILPKLLINFRLWYEGTLKYLGESVTGTESGTQNLEDGSCIIERKQGRDAGGCAGELVGLDCTCTKLSHQKRGSR